MSHSANKSQAMRLNAEETALFCEQAAMVLKSGLSLTDGLCTLCEDFCDSHFGRAAVWLGGEISRTGSLSRALEAAPVLPRYAMRSIHIGEEAGKLDDVLAELGRYYAREAQVRRNLRQAVLYPTLLAILMGAVIAVLVFRVMPVFRQVLHSLGESFSASTQGVVRVGAGIGIGALVLVGVCLLLCLVVTVLMRTRFRARTQDVIFKRVPLLKRIARTIEAERFASAMSMLLGSGYPVRDALEMVRDMAGNDEMRCRVERVIADMDAGASLSAGMEAYGIFDALHARMLRAGAMAGQTDAVLGSIREIYRERLNRDISNAESLIEPILVAFLSVIAGAILLSVMLPLAGILTTML